MCKFINKKLKDGHSMANIFDYLVQGKFDPNNPMHVKRVGEVK
jgi:hypothetical protein